MRSFILLAIALFAFQGVQATPVKPCTDVKERFACRARPDCLWVGVQVGCTDRGSTPPPTAPTLPPTKKPTKVPTSKAPSLPPSKRPTGVPTAPTLPTRKPTAQPTLRKCSSITAQVGCSTVGAGRCEWFQKKCINIRTKQPTSAPTNFPTSQPTQSPSSAPSTAPSKAPTPSRKCTEFTNKSGCCGKAFAQGSSKKCVNTKVPFPGCRWIATGKGRCAKGTATLKPTTRSPTVSLTTKSPTAPTSRAPTPKRVPTRTPTNRTPTKKGAKTQSPTPEYEYEYEY